ncbi:hypothetical protein RJ639_000546 [Escallonia herrerae]|uniref:CCHC-type domain-containing protein n=1 Tax=Escallonia herrerae TaxID=1293975 RepID=A0AA89BP44_9ASTE|nr:hypothetical protein RJ639_000546 [Escallonia herrerae]
MIAKNFNKFMRFRRNGGRRQQNDNNEEKLCYKCHKPGHMKMDCPIYKREKKERRDVWERVKRRQLSKKENKEKEKAMNAEHTPTWSDFDSMSNLTRMKTFSFDFHFTRNWLPAYSTSYSQNNQLHGCYPWAKEYP